MTWLREKSTCPALPSPLTGGPLKLAVFSGGKPVWDHVLVAVDWSWKGCKPSKQLRREMNV